MDWDPPYSRLGGDQDIQFVPGQGPLCTGRGSKGPSLYWESTTTVSGERRNEVWAVCMLGCGTGKLRPL